MKNTTPRSFIRNALAVSLVSAAAFSTTAVNASDRPLATQRFTEYATVIDVQPVYKNIRTREPRQQCWIETQQRLIGHESPRYERHQAYRSGERHSSSSALVGGLIGGVIGNQLGRGQSSSTRTGATVAGAIIGSAVGNESRGQVRRHRRQSDRVQRGAPIYETVEVEKCNQVSESRLEQRLQHYDVTYRYKGRTFTTRTKRDPGARIELQVSVAPARQ